MTIREYRSYNPATGQHERRETPHRVRLFGLVLATVTTVVRWAQTERFRVAYEIIATQRPHRYARLRCNRAFRESWVRGRNAPWRTAAQPSGEVMHTEA